MVLDPDAVAARATMLNIPDADMSTLTSRREVVDEVTAAMKLRRKPIAEKYAGQIDGLYASTVGDGMVDLR